jgi:hypothetical protein
MRNLYNLFITKIILNTEVIIILNFLSIVYEIKGIVSRDGVLTEAILV